MGRRARWLSVPRGPDEFILPWLNIKQLLGKQILAFGFGGDGDGRWEVGREGGRPQGNRGDFKFCFRQLQRFFQHELCLSPTGEQ